MRTRMRVLLAIAIVALLFLPVPDSMAVEPPAPGKEVSQLEQLRWMVGSWAGDDGGVHSEEQWTTPSGGVMLGLHRDVGSQGKAFFEYLRIVESESGVVYVAQPLGRPPTEFALREIEEGRVVFENAAHDFPQRIIYRVGPDEELVARVEGEVSGEPRSSEWHWKKSE